MTFIIYEGEGCKHMINPVSFNRYNVYSIQARANKNNFATKTNTSNVISFGAKNKLGDDFEFADESNLDAMTSMFCDYRRCAGQQNISIDKTREHLEKLIKTPGHKILMMKQDDSYVGFTMLSKTYSTVDLHPVLAIDALYISEAFRGKKLGKKMIGEIQNYAKNENYKGVYVKTWANNQGSNSLYRNTGFHDESAKYSTYFWANSDVLNYDNKYMKDDEN